MSLLAAAAAVLTITVRVYDLHGLPPEQRAEALKLAGKTLAQANVQVHWLDCDLKDGVTPAACAPALVEGEMVLRFQDRTERGDHILGTAIVQDDGPCVLASVYASTIADRAAKTGLPLWIILGRVTAHEIGHLLLGTNSHAPSGLMKASWNLRRPHLDEWLFTRADAARIRSRLLASRADQVAAGGPTAVTRLATTVGSLSLDATAASSAAR